MLKKLNSVPKINENVIRDYSYRWVYSEGSDSQTKNSIPTLFEYSLNAVARSFVSMNYNVNKQPGARKWINGNFNKKLRSSLHRLCSRLFVHQARSLSFAILRASTDYIPRAIGDGMQLTVCDEAMSIIRACSSGVSSLNFSKTMIDNMSLHVLLSFADYETHLLKEGHSGMSMAGQEKASWEEWDSEENEDSEDTGMKPLVQAQAKNNGVVNESDDYVCNITFCNLHNFTLENLRDLDLSFCPALVGILFSGIY